MSDHECRGECQCKKVVIPVIFVPDILGTRLSNARDHKTVWDPMAGMGSYHTPLGTAAIDLSGMITKQTAMANASPLVKKSSQKRCCCAPQMNFTSFRKARRSARSW